MKATTAVLSPHTRCRCIKKPSCISRSGSEFCVDNSDLGEPTEGIFVDHGNGIQAAWGRVEPLRVDLERLRNGCVGIVREIVERPEDSALPIPAGGTTYSNPRIRGNRKGGLRPYLKAELRHARHEAGIEESLPINAVSRK